LAMICTMRRALGARRDVRRCVSSGVRFPSLAALGDEVGKELGWSEWLEVDKERVQKFCDATNDWQWIHLDEARAKESTFGKLVAPGFLSLSLIVPFLDDVVGDVGGVETKINVGVNKVRFTAPVFVGDKLRANFALLALDPVRGGHQATYRVECWTQQEETTDGKKKAGEKPAVVVESIIRYLGK